MKITKLTLLCLLSGLLSLASCGGGDSGSSPDPEGWSTISQAQFETEFNGKETAPWTRMEGTDGYSKAPVVNEFAFDTIAMNRTDGGSWWIDATATSSSRSSEQYTSEFILRSSLIEAWKGSMYSSVTYKKNAQGQYRVFADTITSYKFDFVIDKHFYVTRFIQYKGEAIDRVTNLTWSVGSEWTDITLSEMQSAYNSRESHPYKHFYSHARCSMWGSGSYNISGELKEDGTWEQTYAPNIPPSVTDFLFVNDSNVNGYINESNTFKTYKNERYFITFGDYEVIVDSYFCVINYVNTADRSSVNVHAYWYTK